MKLKIRVLLTLILIVILTSGGTFTCESESGSATFVN